MPATDERTFADLERRIAELEAHVSAQIAATAEFELYRRAVKELIHRVDLLEDTVI